MSSFKDKVLDLMNRMDNLYKPEEDNEDYYNGILTSLAAGESCPGFVREYESGSIINEGIFKTYPIDKTLKYVRTLFGLNDKQLFRIDGAGDNKEANRLVAQVWNTKENNESLDRAMNLCGYVRSRSIEIGPYIVISYISRYENKDITDMVKQMGTIVHITPSYNVEKIKKIGFVPKSTNSQFNYPNRIFFFKGDTPMVEVEFQILDFYNHNKTQGNKEEYAIIAVDTTKLPENCHFYYDPTYICGIFTQDNLPPSVISGIKYVKISDLKEKNKTVNSPDWY